jgi:hypothetical protein
VSIFHKRSSGLLSESGSFEPEAEPPSEIGKILFAFAAGFVRMPFKVLDHFYPKVSSGGFVIIDDYTMPTCKAAMDDFRAKHSIHSPITTIDWSGKFWRK